MFFKSTRRRLATPRGVLPCRKLDKLNLLGRSAPICNLGTSFELVLTHQLSPEQSHKNDKRVHLSGFALCTSCTFSGQKELAGESDLALRLQ